MQLLLAKITATTIALLCMVVVIAILTAIFVVRYRRFRQKKSAGLYLEALKELIRGDEESAFRHLKVVVTKDMGNIDAYLKLGDIFRRRGELNKALQIHRQLTVRGDLSPPDRQELMKSLTLDYEESQKWDKAVTTLQELLSLDKRNLWGLKKLLQLYEMMGEWTRALAVQETIFRNSDQKDNTLLALYEVQIGHQLAARKQYHKARLKYKDALRRDRGCVPAFLSLGDAYLQEGRLDEAIDSWKQLLTSVPSKAYLAFDRLEKTFFEQGQFNEVARIYRDLLERDPNNTRALLALAKIREKKGDLGEAIEFCERALAVDPNMAPVRQLLVKLYCQQGEHNKIVKILDLGARQTLAEYSCGHCGYRSKEPLWRCPQCHQWRTFDL
jgi:lipopolysaccharide biosynthesis regulator YciM